MILGAIVFASNLKQLELKKWLYVQWGCRTSRKFQSFYTDSPLLQSTHPDVTASLTALATQQCWHSYFVLFFTQFHQKLRVFPFWPKNCRADKYFFLSCPSPQKQILCYCYNCSLILCYFFCYGLWICLCWFVSWEDTRLCF